MEKKFLIIYTIAVLLGGGIVYSQPVVRIYQAEDSLVVYQQVSHYLQHFDITEDVFIAITFSDQMPDKTSGITYCVQPVKPFPYQAIRVRIDSGLSKREKRRVLAHEMIHVKQYVKGELELVGDRQVRWKDEIFSNYYLGMNQRFSPWEREAYRTDRSLVKTFKEPTNPVLLAADPIWYANWLSRQEDSAEAFPAK